MSHFEYSVYAVFLIDNPNAIQEEYIWPSIITHQVPAAALANRLMHSDGLTKEEKEIQDQRVVRTFDIPQTKVLDEKKLRLRQQGDTRERPSRRALTGGVVEVRSAIGRVANPPTHTKRKGN